MNRQAAPPRPVRRWAFFAFALAVGAICIRLGFWQLDRLEQRRARNDSLRSRLDLPALRLPQDLSEAGDLAYRRAEAAGSYDHAREVFLGGRSLEEVSGLRVITPLRLEGSEVAVLVDRGWISDQRFRREPGASWAAQGDVVVRGLLLPSQEEPTLAFLADRIPAPGEPPLRTWRVLNVPGMASQLPYPVLEVYLAQESAAPSDAAPRPVSDLDLSDGPHLGYAVQWFAFATIAFVGAILWIRRGPAAGGG